MAAALDLYDPDSPYGVVHYRDKVDVALRLSVAGRALAYNETDLVASGPRVLSVQAVTLDFSSMKVKFESVGVAGLEVRNRSHGFEVAGADDVWVPASIESVEGSDTLLISAKVTAKSLPVKQARFLWRTVPCLFKQCAVYSKHEQFPALPWKGAVLEPATWSAALI